MGHEALHPAERFRQGEDLDCLDEGTYGGGAAVQLDAEHGPEAGLLALRQRMAGMVGQTRIVDRLDRRMGREGLGQGLGRGLLLRQPGEQGAYPAQGHVGVEGRAGDPEAVGPPGQLLVVGWICGDHGPADHVGVAVDELGGRVHHHIGTQGQRALQRRRQEGIVGHHLRPRLMGEATDVAHVDEAQQRVRRSLDENQLRLLRQRLGERRLVVLVDEDDAEVALARAGAEQPVRAAVKVVRGHQQVTGLQRRQGQVDGRHAGRGHHTAGPALKPGEGLGQHVARGIARAGVVVAAFLLEPGEGVVGRQVERRHDRAVGRVAVDAGAGGDGAKVGRRRFGAAHRVISLRAVRRMSPTRASSLRKASWP